MQKKLTVLFAFAIFVLLVGWAVTPAQAHCKKNHANAGPPHCNGDPPLDDGDGSGKLDMKMTIEPHDTAGQKFFGIGVNTFTHRESRCVKVGQSGNGNLAMSLVTRMDDCSRGIKLDLDMCFVVGGCDPIFRPVTSHAFYLNTLAPNRPGNLAPGDLPIAVNAGFFFSEDEDPDNNWSLCFNRAGAGCDQTGDPLIVTRKPDGPDGEIIYEMTTQVPDGNNECFQVDGTKDACEGACLTIGDVDKGCYDVSFNITWEELP